MQLVTQKLAKTFKPGMLFRDSFDFDNTDLLNVMTDIHVHTNYVTINDIHYGFNNPREKIEVYDTVPLPDADGFSLIPGVSDRHIVDDTSCALTEMKQWRVVDWMFNGADPLAQVIEQARTHAKLCERQCKQTPLVPCSAIRYAKLHNMRVLLTRRSDDDAIEIAIAHPNILTREPDRWNPLAIKRGFFERIKHANTTQEEMMEWDDAYERIKLIETRTADTSCVHYITLDELNPEAQTAVLNTWGLTTEKDVIS